MIQHKSYLKVDFFKSTPFANIIFISFIFILFLFISLDFLLSLPLAPFNTGFSLQILIIDKAGNLFLNKANILTKYSLHLGDRSKKDHFKKIRMTK